MLLSHRKILTQIFYQSLNFSSNNLVCCYIKFLQNCDYLYYKIQSNYIIRYKRCLVVPISSLESLGPRHFIARALSHRCASIFAVTVIYRLWTEFS